MEINSWAPIIIAIIVNIPTLITLYVQSKRVGVQKETDEAKLADQFRKLAKEAATDLLSKNSRIKELEDRSVQMDTMQEQITKLAKDLETEKKARIEAEIRAVEADAARIRAEEHARLFEDWATRLIVQITTQTKLTPAQLHITTQE